METWERLAAIAVVLVVTAAVARLVDRRMAGRQLAPEAQTRYRVLRRSVITAVLAVGVLSALLMVPQVRVVAGGVLASSAVVAVVIGLAAQRTLGNFVAGLLIAMTQPLRLGDRVTVAGNEGVVEEIGLTYTWLLADDQDRVAIPNEKLASDTIRNSTIRNTQKLAQVTVQVPLTTDLESLVAALGDGDAEVLVTGLDGNATLTVRSWAGSASAAERLESELRLRVHARLRAHGLYS